MKILFVHPYPLLGGAEWSLVETLRGMRATGAEAALAAPEGELLDRARGEGSPVFPIPALRLRRTAWPWALLRSGFRAARAAAAVLRAAGRTRAEVVHANNLTAHLAAAPAARFQGAAYVLHLRDLQGPRFLLRAAIRKGGLGPALVVAPTRFLAEGIAARTGFPPGRPAIQIVPNPVDAAAFETVGPPPEGPPVIGTAMQFVAWKNPGLFLDAAVLLRREFPAARFEMAGTDLYGENPRFGVYLEAEASRRGLGGSFAPAGRQTDRARLYAPYSLLLFTALDEPFGRAPLEALAAGRPVAAFDAGGIGETFRALGLADVLAPPGDVAALAGIAAGLLRDPSRAAALAARGRAAIRERLSPKAIAERLLAIYPPAG